MPFNPITTSSAGRSRRLKEKEVSATTRDTGRRQRSTLRSTDNRSPPPKLATPAALYAQHNITSAQISNPSSPRVVSPSGAVTSPKLSDSGLTHGRGGVIHLSSLPYTPAALQVYLDNDAAPESDQEQFEQLLTRTDSKEKGGVSPTKDVEIDSQTAMRISAKDKRLSTDSTYSTAAASMSSIEDTKGPEPQISTTAVKPSFTRSQTVQLSSPTEATRMTQQFTSRVLPQYMPDTRSVPVPKALTRPSEIYHAASQPLQVGGQRLAHNQAHHPAESELLDKKPSMESSASDFSTTASSQRTTTQTPPTTIDTSASEQTPVPTKSHQTRSFTPPELPPKQAHLQQGSPEMVPASMTSSIHSDLSGTQTFTHCSSPQSFSNTAPYGNLNESHYLPSRMMPYYPEYGAPPPMSYFYQSYRQPFPHGPDQESSGQPQELLPGATMATEEDTIQLLQRIQRTMPDLSLLLERFRDAPTVRSITRESSFAQSESKSEAAAPDRESFLNERELAVAKREEALTATEQFNAHRAEIIKQQQIVISQQDTIRETHEYTLRVMRETHEAELTRRKDQLEQIQARLATALQQAKIAEDGQKRLLQDLQAREKQDTSIVQDEVNALRRKLESKDKERLEALVALEARLEAKHEAKLAADTVEIKNFHEAERTALELSRSGGIRDIEQKASNARDRWDVERAALQDDLREERSRSVRDVESQKEKLNAQHEQEKLTLRSMLESTHGEHIRRVEKEHNDFVRKLEREHAEHVKKLAVGQAEELKVMELEHKQRADHYDHRKKKWEDEKGRNARAKTEIASMMASMQKLLDNMADGGERGK